MQLVEQHVIEKNDPRYSVIDDAAFKSKNLYNVGNYEVRQSYILEGKYLNYNEVQRRMQSHEAYKALPAKVSQLLVNGRPMKSVNQFYNKRKAELQSKLGHPGTTKRMERLTNKRNRRIDHYLHTASRWIVDDLVAHEIGTLCIGKNDGWKQGANMGKRTNQNFVAIPHARFISMLKYKAELVGIKVIVTEESYTSKASFLDRDEMAVYDPARREKPKFSGKRIERGLYRAADGTLVNADCNGSGNIMRKVAPDAFPQAEGVEDGKGHKPVVHPVRIVVDPLTKPKREILACKKTL